MEQKNSQERDRDQKNRAESQGFKSDGVNEKKKSPEFIKNGIKDDEQYENPPFTVHSTLRLVISDAILNLKNKTKIVISD